MNHTITIIYSCGHREEYRHNRERTGSFTENVPLPCNPCLLKQDALACAACGRAEDRESITIPARAGTAVCRECLEPRRQEAQA